MGHGAVCPSPSPDNSRPRPLAILNTIVTRDRRLACVVSRVAIRIVAVARVRRIAYMASVAVATRDKGGLRTLCLLLCAFPLRHNVTILPIL